MQLNYYQATASVWNESYEPCLAECAKLGSKGKMVTKDEKACLWNCGHKKTQAVGILFHIIQSN